MSTNKTCPVCSTELPPDAPAGVCPKCLLKAGLNDPASESTDDATLFTGYAAPADALTIPPIEHDAAAIVTAPPIGTKVKYLGDYELLDEIARGGMGVVYKARQVRLNRTVALKMILAGQLAGDAEVQRFHSEAEAAANLDHPGIVPIYEVGEHDGHHYFSMGLVQCGSLANRITDGPLPSKEAAELMHKIAEAVAYAHENGVIHRDLKPANILLDQDGQPHITDFGLAKQVKGDSRLTATGQVLGTPSYMPPEQASGRIDQVKESADIYSLGAVLYATLTGRPPFQADNPLDTLMQVLEREPVSPRQLNPSVPRDLETICLKCLEKDRRRRYESAGALAADVECFLHGEPIIARPVGSFERAAKWARRNRKLAALSAALVIVLLLATIISGSFAISENAAKREAVNARKAESEQKNLALKRESEAKTARHQEAEQRRLAEQREAEALWNTYVARMQTLRPVWERGEFGQLEVLLDQYEPKDGEPDFRGWEWRYLRDQCRANIRILTTNARTKNAVWRPDGKRLAIRRTDGAVVIWDTDARRIVRSLSGSGDMPIAWSPDGRLLAVGLGESDLDIWDTVTGEKVRQIHCKLQRTNLRHSYGLDWSHNGELLAYGGDGFLEILASDGTPQRQFRVGRVVTGNWIRAVDWHPADMRLGVVDHDGYVYAFDGLNGQQLWRTEATNIDCCDVAWRPDGKRLACSARYPVYAAKVFDERGELVATLPRVYGSISWSPDGNRIAATGPSQFVHIWHVESDERHEIPVHKGSIFAMAWRPASDEIFTVGYHGTLKLWNASMTHEPALTIHAHPRPAPQSQAPRVSVSWSPDSAHLISGGPRGRVAIWNSSNGEQEAELVQEGSAVHVVAWHPDGRMVAAITEAGRITLWDADTKQVLKTLVTGSRSVDFRYLDWSRDGERLLCDVAEAPLNQEKPVYYWEDRGLGERRQLTTSFRNVVSWHPDGDRIALMRNRQVEMWSVPEHRLLYKFEQGAWNKPIWEPRGRIMAFGQNGLRYVNPHSGEFIAAAALHAGTTYGDWSPAGDRIVTAGREDARLKSVDAATGDEVFTLSTDGAGFTDVAFSPDGRRIATADNTGFVRIWGSPEIETPGDFDYLATGVLAKVKTPDAD